VRKDPAGRAELLKRECTDHPGHPVARPLPLEILAIDVEAWLGVLDEHAGADPVGELASGLFVASAHVVPLGEGELHAHRVVRMAVVQFHLLLRRDHIVGRADDVRQLARLRVANAREGAKVGH
jgi:hypothetical protein